MATVGDLLTEAHGHISKGRRQRGMRILEHVLAFDPDQPGALALLGLALLEEGDTASLDQAAGHLWRAYGKGVPAHHVLLPLAAAYVAADGAEKGAAAAFAGLAETPGNGEVAHLAAVCSRGARRCYDLAVALAPGDASALYNAARNLQEREPLEKGGAPESRTRALAGRYGLILSLEPARVDARVQLSNLAMAAKDHGIARRTLPAALALEPASSLALEKYAVTSLVLLDHGTAARAFDRAADFEDPPGKLWADRLFSMIYRDGMDDAELFRVNRAWGERVEAGMPDSVMVPARPRGKIRIAYLSPEFRKNHNHMASFGATLAAHDRDRFEIFCYSDWPTVDAEAEWVRARADGFRVVHGGSPQEIARRIAADRPDIAVNLCCWYALDRMPFGTRMAPVQVAYNNEVSTSGLSRIDWRVTDALADPPGVERWNSERLWRLEKGFSSWRVPADLPDPGPLPMAETGVPTFGVFNNISKLSPTAIRVYAGLVASIPGARLLLKAVQLDDASVRRRVAALFEEAGLAAQLIDMIGYVPGEQGHFAAMARADLALDPFPFCGGKSTVDVLWMGLPVITLDGRFTMARMGTSILTRAGLPELVARSEAEYVEKARTLAQDPDRLARLRAGMRSHLAGSLLMDAEAHTRDLEAAYRHFMTEFESKESGRV
ncbi:MAG: hypothetical protein NXI16_08085 [Alphaproteobacteria bacterium]|nr:hypothetical protein [Alphaproteobacteria bacterium]